MQTRYSTAQSAVNNTDSEQRKPACPNKGCCCRSPPPQLPFLTCSIFVIVAQKRGTNRMLHRRKAPLAVIYLCHGDIVCVWGGVCAMEQQLR